MWPDNKTSFTCILVYLQSHIRPVGVVVANGFDSRDDGPRLFTVQTASCHHRHSHQFDSFRRDQPSTIRSEVQEAF